MKETEFQNISDMSFGSPTFSLLQPSSNILLMNSSRYAEEGEGEDPAVALLAASVEELAPRAKPVPPGHKLVRDVRAEIHRVPRLGRPDQG